MGRSKGRPVSLEIGLPLIEIDPLSGALERYDYDHDTGLLAFSKTQNVDRVLDMNAESYNQGMARDAEWRGCDNDMWHVASIPLVTLQAWLNEFNSVRAEGSKHRSIYAPDEEWDKFVLMRLDSSDFRKLKTAPVKIL